MIQRVARLPMAMVGAMVDEVCLADLTTYSEFRLSDSQDVATMSAAARFGPKALEHLENNQTSNAEKSTQELKQ